MNKFQHYSCSILLFCIFFSFSCCEPYRHILFNREKRILHGNSSSCKIKIEADVMSVYRIGFKITALGDGVELKNVNAWLVELSNANEVYFETIKSYSHQDSLIDRTSISLRNNECLKFRSRFKLPSYKKKTPFVFPKSENVLCNGRPIFSEPVEYVLEHGGKK